MFSWVGNGDPVPVTLEGGLKPGCTRSAETFTAKSSPIAQAISPDEAKVTAHKLPEDVCLNRDFVLQLKRLVDVPRQNSMKMGLGSTRRYIVKVYPCVAEAPGDYVVTSPLSVSTEVVFGKGPIAELPSGTIIKVEEVHLREDLKRVRARITAPFAGYVSLRNIENGYQWATPIRKERGDSARAQVLAQAGPFAGTAGAEGTPATLAIDSPGDLTVSNLCSALYVQVEYEEGVMTQDRVIGGCVLNRLDPRAPQAWPYLLSKGQAGAMCGIELKVVESHDSLVFPSDIGATGDGEANGAGSFPWLGVCCGQRAMA